MIFEVYGLVRSRGKKIANGVDGRFETHDPRIIRKLQELGFKEVKEPLEIKEPFTREQLDDKTGKELKGICFEMGLKGFHNLSKDELIEKILNANNN